MYNTPSHPRQVGVGLSREDAPAVFPGSHHLHVETPPRSKDDRRLFPGYLASIICGAQYLRLSVPTRAQSVLHAHAPWPLSYVENNLYVTRRCTRSIQALYNTISTVLSTHTIPSTYTKHMQAIRATNMHVRVHNNGKHGSRRQGSHPHPDTLQQLRSKMRCLQRPPTPMNPTPSESSQSLDMRSAKNHLPGQRTARLRSC